MAYSTLYLLFLSGMTVGLFACSRTQPTPEELPRQKESIVWVSAHRADCTGVGPMGCLQVYKGESIDSADWQIYHGSVKEFEFTEGYIYKLLVKEPIITPGKTPEQPTELLYELVEVLEKEIDNKFKLHDNWKLTTIAGKPFNLNSLRKTPTLRFDIDYKTVTGSNGCHTISSTLERAAQHSLIFGPLGSSKAACPNAMIPDRIVELLQQVTSYRVDEQNLYLYDADEQELLRYQKITS